MILFLKTRIAIMFLFGYCFVNAHNEDDLARFDCYPELLNQQTVKQSLCETRGCIWKKPASDKVRLRLFL